MKQQFKQAVFMPKDAALCIHFTDIQNFFNFYYGVCWDSFLKKLQPRESQAYSSHNVRPVLK